MRGYTFIKRRAGSGRSGERRPDDYALEEKNAVVILACEESQAERIIIVASPQIERVRRNVPDFRLPVGHRAGGLILSGLHVQ